MTLSLYHTTPAICTRFAFCDLLTQIAPVRRQETPVPARCQVNGPELHGDVKPLEDAAGRPGSAVDGFFKLSRAVSENAHPVVMSHAAGSQEVVQSSRSRRRLVMDIGVQPCFSACETSPSDHQVHMPALVGVWMAVLKPRRVDGQSSQLFRFLVMLWPDGRQGCAGALMLQGRADHTHTALHAADRNGVGSWQDFTEQGGGCGIEKMRSLFHLKVFKLWCHAGGHHLSQGAERGPGRFVRSTTVADSGTLHFNQTKHRFDLALMPAL